MFYLLCRNLACSRSGRQDLGQHLTSSAVSTAAPQSSPCRKGLAWPLGFADDMVWLKLQQHTLNRIPSRANTSTWLEHQCWRRASRAQQSGQRLCSQAAAERTCVALSLAAAATAPRTGAPFAVSLSAAAHAPAYEESLRWQRQRGRAKVIYDAKLDAKYMYDHNLSDRIS